MTAPKAGYKGAVWIDDKKIAGSATWTYSGETRNMQDADEFEDEFIKQVPLQIVGGDITITGNYLLDSDDGQQLLKTNFNSAKEISDIKLYTDKSNGNNIFMKLTATSRAIVTNVNNVGDDKSGIGTFSCTIHVNGELEQSGESDEIAVETVGAIDFGEDGVTATLIGELLNLGGDTPDCYFEYGLTESYEIGNSAKNEDMAAVGMFDAALSELTNDKTYHYRAVGQKSGGDLAKVYGVDKTFLTSGGA